MHSVYCSWLQLETEKSAVRRRLSGNIWSEEPFPWGPADSHAKPVRRSDASAQRGWNISAMLLQRCRNVSCEADFYSQGQRWSFRGHWGECVGFLGLIVIAAHLTVPLYQSLLCLHNRIQSLVFITSRNHSHLWFISVWVSESPSD